MLIWANKVKNDPARADQDCAQHVMTMPAHLPLSHLFTRIAPTDNMQPKSDDSIISG